MSKQRKRHQPDRRVSAPGMEADQIDQAVTLFSTIADVFTHNRSISLLDHERRRSATSYVFGMLLAYGKREHLPPAAVMGTMHMLLVAKWGYDMQAADHLTHALINATQQGVDPVQRAMIYRGMDGLTRWTTAGQQAAVDDFLHCVTTIDTRSAL